MTCPKNQKGEHYPRLPNGAHDYEYIPFCATRVCNLCQDHAGKDSCNNCIWRRPAGEDTSPFYEKPDDDQDDLFSVPGDKPVCMADNKPCEHEWQAVGLPFADVSRYECRLCGATKPRWPVGGSTPPFNGNTPVQRDLKPNRFNRSPSEASPILETLTVPLEFDVQLGRGGLAAQNIPITNVPWTVIQHSPTGFEWGYGGSGPADLALNILNAFRPPRTDGGGDGHEPMKCYHGYCSKTAWALHQAFKWRFIKAIPKPGGSIEKGLILEYLEYMRDHIAILEKEPPQ